MSIIDHISLSVTSVDRSVPFYERALAPLGIKFLMRNQSGVGFGAMRPQFWLRQGRGTFQSDEQLRILTPAHVCFAARSRDEVDAFYRAALRAGGRDFGPSTMLVTTGRSSWIRTTTTSKRSSTENRPPGRKRSSFFVIQAMRGAAQRAFPGSDVGTGFWSASTAGV